MLNMNKNEAKEYKKHSFKYQNVLKDYKDGITNKLEYDTLVSYQQQRYERSNIRAVVVGVGFALHIAGKFIDAMPTLFGYKLSIDNTTISIWEHIVNTIKNQNIMTALFVIGFYILVCQFISYDTSVMYDAKLRLSVLQQEQDNLYK
jgi:hypothetical protein